MENSITVDQINQTIETNQINETNEIENFLCQDDSIVHENNVENQMDDDEYKYTKIDCLDEDPVIPGQRYFCISFISPEGLMNCKTRGFKLRGVYGSMSEAREACKKFQKQDKYFDVYVAEVGKWCPWDPTPQQIKQTIYKGKDQNEIMKNIQEKEAKQLNEIVGRQKDKINSAKVFHKERVANAMKQNLNSFKEQKETNNSNQDTEKAEKDAKIEKARNIGKKQENHSEKKKQMVLDRLRKNIAKS